MTENKPAYTQSGWKLTELFESFADPALSQAYQDLEARVEKLVSQRGELKPEISAEKFLQLLQELENVNKIAYRLYGFSSLSFAANTQDQAAQTNIARFQQFAAEMENRVLIPAKNYQLRLPFSHLNHRWLYLFPFYRYTFAKYLPV